MSIDLRAWTPADTALLEEWIAAPHVARWWKPPPVAEVRAWRIDLDGRPVGYAQAHEPRLEGAAWAAEEGVGPGTRVVGLLLGDADAVNRKHGRAAIRALATLLFADAGVDRLVAAPHPDNWGAIIAFKRAGFRERGRRQFRAGPVMVLTAAKAVWKG